MAADSLVRVGTAGWSIRRDHDALYGPGESHLARYATRFQAAEINSCFYRPHRPATYARWAAAVPEAFRFAVKMPKRITHELRLVGAREAIADFLDETCALGSKRGPVLIQLPPKLAFAPEPAAGFFAELRALYAGPAVCEPRNASWYTEEADDLLIRHEIARVAADPSPAPGAGQPGGWRGITYYRLHGSPRMYHSAYEQDFLAQIAAALRGADSPERWCIFDNTTRGAAVLNGLEMEQLLQR